MREGSVNIVGRRRALPARTPALAGRPACQETPPRPAIRNGGTVDGEVSMWDSQAPGTGTVKKPFGIGKQLHIIAECVRATAYDKNLAIGARILSAFPKMDKQMASLPPQTSHFKPGR